MTKVLHGFKSSVKFKLLLAFFSVTAIVAVAFFQFKNIGPVQAQASPPEALAPSVEAQYGDDEDFSPDLPQDCGQHIGQYANYASDGNDPDCLRVRVTDPANTVYTKDFRFCLRYSNNPGQPSCTRYASEIGLAQDYAPGNLVALGMLAK